MGVPRRPADEPDGPMVRLEGVSKRFGEVVAVNQVNLAVRRGEFLTLLGPSGCGKTTTLMMIAGFEVPDEGAVFIGGQEVTHAPPYRRPVNTVFQNYALFPHMTVYENVAFGLRMRRLPGDEIRRRVLSMLERVGLVGLERRYPRQLSGGQQQRVALARALVNEPEVLLLDEPLGALDLKLRKQMQVELKRLQRELGTTFIYVTHDQDEALTMSDRIAVMTAGRIEQLGTAEEIYERPVSRFVAEFVGEINLLRVPLRGREGGRLIVEVLGRRMAVPYDWTSHEQGTTVLVGLRPERLRLASPGTERAVVARVCEVTYAGAFVRLQVYAAGARLRVLTPPGSPLADMSPGAEVFLDFDERDVVVLREEAVPEGSASPTVQRAAVAGFVAVEAQPGLPSGGKPWVGDRGCAKWP